MEKVDVVIVGGGIAGLAAATTLCSGSDLKVILVEKRSIGANKTTPVVFPEMINEFGLEDSIQQYYTAFAFHSPLGAIVRYDFQRNALASLNYKLACTSMYEQAAINGLEFSKAKVLNWLPAIPDPAQPLIIYLDNADSIRTQVLIDASGQAQWAAKQLQIQLSPYYSVCYGEFLTGCSFGDSSTFRFLTPNSRYGTGGGWFYPTGESSASMGYGILVRTPHKQEGNPAFGYLAAKQEFQPYTDWVKEGVIQKIECGIIPVGRISRFVDNRILIVGDAAGQATPWCMMGVNSSLNNGRMCAQVVLHAFAQKRFDRSMLSLYERQWVKSNRVRFWRAVRSITTWMQATDEDWNKFIVPDQVLSPEKQLQMIRDNPTPPFWPASAVPRYITHRLAKGIRKLRAR